MLKLTALIMLTVWQTAQAAPIEPWTKSLTCADQQVSVETICHARGEDPYCTRQTLRFGDGQRKFVFNHKWKDGFTDFIWLVSCSRVKGRDYVILNITNYGTCVGCWWLDVFDPHGKYLGSSEAYQRDRPPFKMKFLPTAGLSLNAIDKADIRSSFELTRPRLDD